MMSRAEIEEYLLTHVDVRAADLCYDMPPEYKTSGVAQVAIVAMKLIEEGKVRRHVKRGGVVFSTTSKFYNVDSRKRNLTWLERNREAIKKMEEKE